VLPYLSNIRQNILIIGAELRKLVVILNLFEINIVFTILFFKKDRDRRWWWWLIYIFNIVFIVD